MSDCHSGRDGTCRVIDLETRAGARFLKSRRAAARALNLAGLGAGRTGLELDEVNPVFTSQVNSSTVVNNVKSVCKVERKINQKTQVSTMASFKTTMKLCHQRIRGCESTLPYTGGPCAPEEQPAECLKIGFA